MGVLCGAVLFGHILRPGTASISDHVDGQSHRQSGSRGHVASGVCRLSGVRHDAAEVLGGGRFWILFM